MRDFYEVLGVQRHATAADIKRAYHRLAHQYHPDKNPGNAAAEERFKEASVAYSVLSDAAKRQRYNLFGTAGLGAFRSDGGDFSANVGEMFAQVFGDLFARKPRAQKGSDRIYPLKIDVHTALHGGERLINVVRNARCSMCSGTGAKPGTSPQLCHVCSGRGELRIQRGVFGVSKRCGPCAGRGKVIAAVCKDCDGNGSIERSVQLRVRIPAASDNGTVLRYAGEGEPGRGGGAAGDLRVILEVS